MDILQSAELINVNISNLTTAIEYTATENVTILAQVMLNGIVGNGNYAIHLYIDDYLVVPERDVGVPNGTTKVIAQSRSVILLNGRTASLKIQGLPIDTSVNVTAYIINTTAVTEPELTDEIIPIIESSISDSLSNVTIHQQRVVLGKCAQPIKQTLTPQAQTVTPMPKRVKCP